MDPETAYDVLDLDPSASEDEIKQAYRTLTKEYHPDLTDGETREYWIQINDAKQTLLNGASPGQTANGTTGTTTSQRTQSGTGTSKTDGQSQRSYQRDHTDRKNRRTNTNSSRSRSTSNNQRQQSVRQISIEELGQRVIGDEVRIEGVIADVTTTTSDDIELVVTLASPQNPDDWVKVYIHESLSDRPTFRSEDKYRITGVVRDGVQSDELEIHVSDGHSVTRLHTRRDWSHVSEQFQQETSRTSRTQRTESRRTTSETAQASSVTSTLSSVGLLLLGILMWPGLIVQQHVRPLFQIVIILVATGLMSAASSTPFVYELLYLAVLLFFTVGGMFAFGLTSISLLWGGDVLAGVGFLFAFMLVTGYYVFIRLAIDAE